MGRTRRRARCCRLCTCGAANILYSALEGQKPDGKAWIVYLNGEEFPRVERREDLAMLGIEGPPPVRLSG